jgi:hypothetical protein
MQLDVIINFSLVVFTGYYLHSPPELQHDVQQEHVSKSPRQSASRTLQDGTELGRLQTAESMFPIKALLLRYKTSSAGRLLSSVGRRPNSKLSRRSTRSRLSADPNCEGILLSSLLFANSNSRSEEHNPISVGMFPTSWFEAIRGKRNDKRAIVARSGVVVDRPRTDIQNFQILHQTYFGRKGPIKAIIIYKSRMW